MPGRARGALARQARGTCGRWEARRSAVRPRPGRFRPRAVARLLRRRPRMRGSCRWPGGCEAASCPRRDRPGRGQRRAVRQALRAPWPGSAASPPTVPGAWLRTTRRAPGRSGGVSGGPWSPWGGGPSSGGRGGVGAGGGRSRADGDLRAPAACEEQDGGARDREGRPQATGEGQDVWRLAWPRGGRAGRQPPMQKALPQVPRPQEEEGRPGHRVGRGSGFGAIVPPGPWPPAAPPGSRAACQTFSAAPERLIVGESRAFVVT